MLPSCAPMPHRPGQAHDEPGCRHRSAPGGERYEYMKDVSAMMRLPPATKSANTPTKARVATRFTATTIAPPPAGTAPPGAWCGAARVLPLEEIHRAPALLPSPAWLNDTLGALRSSAIRSPAGPRLNWNMPASILSGRTRCSVVAHHRIVEPLARGHDRVLGAGEFLRHLHHVLIGLEIGWLDKAQAPEEAGRPRPARPWIAAPSAGLAAARIGADGGVARRDHRSSVWRSCAINMAVSPGWDQVGASTRRFARTHS